eukprot:CAMPEP_0181516544 /NCGR_PEP_ID=MMETSP1110-20121109/64169_1 /TAXON_ID=174948 /ORGANISM="Symbiodinium sp., Strain CCMP421" /LENGTH=39 /DNA_ID= /DNA_START= /DNA_END= /DNA_ORIENTATION=
MPCGGSSVDSSDTSINGNRSSEAFTILAEPPARAFGTQG